MVIIESVFNTEQSLELFHNGFLVFSVVKLSHQKLLDSYMPVKFQS